MGQGLLRGQCFGLGLGSELGLVGSIFFSFWWVWLVPL